MTMLRKLRAARKSFFSGSSSHLTLLTFAIGGFYGQGGPSSGLMKEWASLTNHARALVWRRRAGGGDW